MWIEQLVSQGLLDRDGEYATLVVTEAGWSILRGESEGVRLLAGTGKTTTKKGTRATKAAADGWEGVDRDLFENLRSLRRTVAESKGVPPFIVFGDASLRDMARRRPTTLEEFEEVHGVGTKKAGDYGSAFLRAIASHLAEAGAS
jgi:ATP-dependent DNA helicase RecQ